MTEVPERYRKSLLQHCAICRASFPELYSHKEFTTRSSIISSREAPLFWIRPLNSSPCRGHCKRIGSVMKNCSVMKTLQVRKPDFTCISSSIGQTCSYLALSVLTTFISNNMSRFSQVRFCWRLLYILLYSIQLKFQLVFNSEGSGIILGYYLTKAF